MTRVGQFLRIVRLFETVGANATKARRASRLLIYWHRSGLASDRARHLSCALSHQAAMLDHIAADESAENDDIRRNLALVAFHSSLASGRRSGHQETTQ